MSLAAAVIAMAVVTMAMTAESKLTPDYYAQSCPQMAQLISDVVTSKQISSPTTAAGALRVFFHDCFLNGCDASILVSSTPFNRAERDSDINLSLPGDGFDVIVRAKTAIELSCPGIVSCADILALATRDLVTMLGGPFYTVRLGRKDSFASISKGVDEKLPRSNSSVSDLISIFADRGFSIQELVALSGAHTVGFAHCKEFADRFGANRPTDRSVDPRFAEGIRSACKNYSSRPTVAVFNDVMTPNKFDNMYFKNLKRGMGLLATDQALAEDPRTRPFVDLYAADEAAFFRDFSRTIEKLSVYGVKTGRQGEIRRRCDQINSFSS